MKRNIVVFLVIIMLTGVISSCSNTPSGETELPQAQERNMNQGELDNKGNEGQGENGSAGNSVEGGQGNGMGLPEQGENLSESEIDGILYMREEEKLARDLYQKFYEMWGQTVFQNISGSEQSHIEATLTLMQRYGINDTAEGKGIDEFSNPELQQLYDELLTQGKASLEGALRAGAAVEEIDILDLEERMAQTDNADILRVYQNLASGSQNHLRAFVSVLENRTGNIYEPVYMTADDYQAIMATSSGNAGYGQPGGKGPGGNNR